MKITKAKVSPCTSPRASVRNRIVATKLSQEALSVCGLITRAICQDKGIIGFVKILFGVETINDVMIHRYI